MLGVLLKHGMFRVWTSCFALINTHGTGPVCLYAFHLHSTGQFSHAPLSKLQALFSKSVCMARPIYTAVPQISAASWPQGEFITYQLLSFADGIV